MAAGVAGADLVHSHTWYANLGGHLAKLVHGIPHVATVHSLEPMRPWKREQLGGGYELSSFAERTSLEAADAIVAVSAAHLREILECYPAIDPGRTTVDLQRHRQPTSTGPTAAPTRSSGTGSIPARPSVVFVGRITRQKGLTHLLDAAPAIDDERPARRSAPARRTRPRSPRRWRRRWPPSAQRAATWSGSRRCCRSPR